MSSSQTPAVFSDISVLIDFCRVYYKSHRYADKVLRRVKERGGEIHISSHAEKALNKGLANRQRLLDHLSLKASEYFNEYENPQTRFKADILNYTHLQQAVNFELDEDYLPDIEALRMEFDEVGISDFREQMDDLRIQAKNERRELEMSLISDTYDRGGRATLDLELRLSSYTTMEVQTQSLIDAVYWCSGNRDWILVRNESDVFQERDEVAESIYEVTGTEPRIRSPKEVAETSGWLEA